MRLFALLLLSVALFHKNCIAAEVEVDHYEILGIARGADQKEIRTAYKKLSLKFHPDKNANKEKAKEMFDLVAKAYEVLGDPDKRAVYDSYGTQSFTSKQEAQMHNPGAIKTSFYSKDSSVHTLKNWMFDGWNFQGERANGPLAKHDKWMIEFYAPWCVHCQNMVGQWKKAAASLEGEVAFGAANCEAEPNLCRVWNIHSYPTVIYVAQGEVIQHIYEGEHTAEAFVDFARSMSANTVITVTPQTFEEKVTQNKKPTFVLFTAGSWCGPCETAKIHWRRFSNSVSKHGAECAVIDCDKYREFCGEMGVGGYPHIRGFSYGGPAQGEEMFKMRMGIESGLEVMEKMVKLLGSHHSNAEDHLHDDHHHHDHDDL